MRHLRPIGSVCRWAALSVVVGCTQAPAHFGDRTESPPAAAVGDAAAAAVVDVAAAEAVADADAAEADAADALAAAAGAAGAAAPAEPTAASDEAAPREAAKPVIEEYAAGVPRVLLSAAHAKLCKVGVGDVLPSLELPRSGGGAATLDSLAGRQATVVLFWTPDRWMAESALRDLARDVAGRYPSAEVGVVGVAVSTPAAEAEKAATVAGGKVPQLLDADGAAFAQVGAQLLPRVYVLDGERRIAWFDVEYSESTRRELQQTLEALTGAGR